MVPRSGEGHRSVQSAPKGCPSCSLHRRASSDYTEFAVSCSSAALLDLPIVSPEQVVFHFLELGLGS